MKSQLWKTVNESGSGFVRLTFNTDKWRDAFENLVS